MLRKARSIGVGVLSLIAALTVGLGISSAAPVSASTVSAMNDAYTPPMVPLIPVVNPLTVGLRVIDAVAEGIADVVELVATPPAVTIPAPDGRES